MWSINAGANPKLTISAKESSCFPKSEPDLSKRATNPSKKSNTAARSTSKAAKEKFPVAEKATEAAPTAKFKRVIKFGICLTIYLKSIYNLLLRTYKNKVKYIPANKF
jgi:hypothetical protein